MKVFFAILVVVASVCADEWTPKDKDQLNKIHLECAQRSSLSPKTVALLTRNGELPDEERVRKYVVCTSVKLGFFDRDHGYNADRIAKQFKMDLDQEEEIKRSAEECIAKNYNVKETVDVAVFKVHNCFVNTPVGQELQNIYKKLTEAFW